MKHAMVVLLAAAAMGQSKAPDPVTQARQFYNDQKYDEAIRIADEARAVPALAPAATLVSARAHLERFRQSGAAPDLETARASLKTIAAEALAPRDRVELLIALGECLYFDDQDSLDDRFSAAAEQFDLALAHADLLDRQSRDLLFDWWAGALDREAQQDVEGDRQALYARIVAGAEHELARDERAASASYWLAAGAQGTGDLSRAIGAAAAAWSRAATLGPRGAALRVDLDRLMRQVILPDRARELATGGANPREMLAVLERQWQQLTEKWQPQP